MRTDRGTTELCRSRLRSLYGTLHKKDRAVSLIRDIVENTEAFIRKVQEIDSVLNNTIEPYPDLNYVQQLKQFAVSCYWTGSKKEADMMFWAVLILVLLAFSDLYLPDFTKPAKKSMTQYMVCAVLTLVVILKLAQAASQPCES
ncbi:MAG: hypothetical protein M0P73_07570 [Syntrophobacterales bacterium]|nr:hypothetical protein [Syntrophobacterales bacterium]